MALVGGVSFSSCARSFSNASESTGSGETILGASTTYLGAFVRVRPKTIFGRAVSPSLIAHSSDLLERNSARAPISRNHIRPLSSTPGWLAPRTGRLFKPISVAWPWYAYVRVVRDCLDELNLDLYSETDFETESPQPQPSYVM